MYGCGVGIIYLVLAEIEHLAHDALEHDNGCTNYIAEIDYFTVDYS